MSAPSATTLKATGTGWKTKVLEKRAECFSKIPQQWRLDENLLSPFQTPLEASKNNVIGLNIVRHSEILSEREFAISENYQVSQLLDSLAAGEFTALEVTVAFSKRAAIAHQLTNCITEMFFDEAAERARELDDKRGKGQLAGPLHGLPVSIKDTFQIVGTSATVGLVSFLDNKSAISSPLVDMLLDLGAVVYCKTNVSQALMSADSQNNVFGRTLNPWNTSLGAGGSSGGEGALVAMRGSPLGVGTDAAGSIRIPSLCCGTYGFRPTAGRVSFSGQQLPVDAGLPTIMPCTGPIANDFDALEVFMKAMVGARPRLYDCATTDVARRTGLTYAGGELGDKKNMIKKLRFGILAEDPKYPLHPPVRRAVAEAVRLLTAAGHEAVYLSPEECCVSQALEVAWTMFSLDDVPLGIVNAGGEPPSPSLVRTAETWSKVNQSSLAHLKTLAPLKQLSGLHRRKGEIAEVWHRLWKAHELDAVVGPAAQSTAVEHDFYGLPPYTVLQNLLDFPACVIPFGKAETSNENETFDPKPGQIVPPYHPANIDGAPCSIQVFTTTMRDEECLGIGKIVDSCINAVR